MKTITVSIKPPNCFGNQSPKNEQCTSCIFCFDCVEKKTEKENKYGKTNL